MNILRKWEAPIASAAQTYSRDLCFMYSARIKRKGPVQPDKPVLNKLRYLCVAERAHFVICIRRHEILISLGQRPSLREAKQARLIGSSSVSPPGGSRHTHFRPLDAGKALAAEEEDRSDTENADHHHDDPKLARPPCSINEGSNWPNSPSPARRWMRIVSARSRSRRVPSSTATPRD